MIVNTRVIFVALLAADVAWSQFNGTWCEHGTLCCSPYSIDGWNVAWWAGNGLIWQENEMDTDFCFTADAQCSLTCNASLGFLDFVIVCEPDSGNYVVWRFPGYWTPGDSSAYETIDDNMTATLNSGEIVSFAGQINTVCSTLYPGISGTITVQRSPAVIFKWRCYVALHMMVLMVF